MWLYIPDRHCFPPLRIGDCLWSRRAKQRQRKLKCAGSDKLRRFHILCFTIGTDKFWNILFLVVFSHELSFFLFYDGQLDNLQDVDDDILRFHYICAVIMPCHAASFLHILTLLYCYTVLLISRRATGLKVRFNPENPLQENSANVANKEVCFLSNTGFYSKWYVVKAKCFFGMLTLINVPRVSSGIFWHWRTAGENFFDIISCNKMTQSTNLHFNNLHIMNIIR